MKHSANRAVVEGKRIVLVDDSLVRGTTSVKIVRMMREAGAREVHFRIASPPITHPDFYGIDTPERDKLLAATHDLEEHARATSAPTSLAFLSVDGIYRAMGDDRPRPGAAAVHRPLLHRRLPDAADRSRGRDAAPLAMLAEATEASSGPCSVQPRTPATTTDDSTHGPHDEAPLEPPRGGHRRVARHRPRRGAGLRRAPARM